MIRGAPVSHPFEQISILFCRGRDLRMRLLRKAERDCTKKIRLGNRDILAARQSV